MTPCASCLLLVGLSAVALSGQIERRGSAGKSLYQLSLSACIQAKAEKGDSTNNVIVLENNVLRDSDSVAILPAKMGSANIEYLDPKAIAVRYRRLAKELAILEILPIRNAGDMLIVNCAEYKAAIRKRRLVLSVTGGYIVHWRLDCSTGEYATVNVERWFPRLD